LGNANWSLSNLQDDLTLDVSITFEFLSLSRLLKGKRLVYMNGPLEAKVNCLKLQKRLMFGCANFDLLRLHVLRRA